MKKLELEFVSNVDKLGLHKFRQLKRDGNVAMYERRPVIVSTKNQRRTETVSNYVHSYEVFVVKVTKAGTVFAAGASPTGEDRESYPGYASFGKFAFSCKTLERAEFRYTELLQRQNEKQQCEHDDAVESDASKSKRGRKAKIINMPIPRRGATFSMKNLMQWSGQSQPNLYIRLKRMIEQDLVRVAGTVEKLVKTRGKPEVLYCSNTDDYAQYIEAV